MQASHFRVFRVSGASRAVEWIGGMDYGYTHYTVFLLGRLDADDNGIKPSLFIHPRCKRLLECLPFLQADPDHPADVLKTNTNDEGMGGDDAADALRYLIATPARRVYQVKLRGL